MTITKEDIQRRLEKNKKVGAKVFVNYYRDAITTGVPYDIILNRLEKEFNISFTYSAFSSGVSRYINKQKNSPKAAIIKSPSTRKELASKLPTNKSKETKLTSRGQNQEETPVYKQDLEDSNQIQVKGF